MAIRRKYTHLFIRVDGGKWSFARQGWAFLHYGKPIEKCHIDGIYDPSEEWIKEQEEKLNKS